MPRCERPLCKHGQPLATRIVEWTECPHCGFRIVRYVCDECDTWLRKLATAAKPEYYANCPSCHRKKALETAFAFLGEA